MLKTKTNKKNQEESGEREREGKRTKERKAY